GASTPGRAGPLVLPLPLASLAAGPPGSARAAVPEPPPGGPRAAPRDTSHFLPHWLHLHGSAGFGWISSPTAIRQRYEAGQDFEAGPEGPGPAGPRPGPNR